MIAQEAKGFAGYYEIPGFSRYAITKDGKIINKKTNSVLNGSINPAGYWNYRLTDATGHTLTWGLHRLLGFVFKHPGTDIKHLVINHIDGNKSNNNLDNLEWTTHQGNLEHAGREKLTEKCMPISVRDVDTGAICNYPSLVACARVLGFSKDAVNHRVKCGMKRVFPERKQYRIQSDEAWYIPTDVERELMLNGCSKRVQVKFVLTGQVVEFKQMQDLSTYLNTPPSTLTLWIQRPGQPVLPGYIQLKWATDISPWREVDDPYLELDETTGCRSVVVINASNRNRLFFPSAIECAKAMGVTPTALNWRLKSRGEIIYPDGYMYSYYSDSF